MDAVEIALLGAMLVALAGLLAAERAASQRGIWVAKPLASAAFVALALRHGVPSAFDVFHAGLLAAVALCFVGDLLLIPRETRIFRASILAFLLAHVAFIVALFARGASLGGLRVMAIAIVPLALVALAVGRWILPKAPRSLQGAVVAYIVVITAMVAVAAGTREAWLAGAALAFWGNDIFVARDRFVQRSWLNRLAGLPLYYGAMAVFALSASGSLG